jgi:hypothetical protein
MSFIDIMMKLCVITNSSGGINLRCECWFFCQLNYCREVFHYLQSACKELYCVALHAHIAAPFINSRSILNAEKHRRNNAPNLGECERRCHRPKGHIHNLRYRPTEERCRLIHVATYLIGCSVSVCVCVLRAVQAFRDIEFSALVPGWRSSLLMRRFARHGRRLAHSIRRSV